MARKLIFGNDIVSFVVNTTPSTRTGVLVINGNYPVEKILTITDATTNQSLYSFADPTTIITCSQDYINKQTTINISKVPTETLSVNRIEIFIEKEELEIKPTRTYRDPVSKFRVSQGESIIDTDFEYGLQPTKWETVRLVNNIPTYFSSIFEDEAINAESISVEAQSSTGNDKVTVITNVEHNLVKGSLIEITGLTDVKYEGVYIVTDVPDATTFSYKTSFSSNISVNNLQTIYTLIYPGSFYTGSSIDLADVQVQSGAASTLVVSTPNIHGLKNDTKIYLKQSRVVKSYDFESVPTNLNVSDVVGFASTTLGSLINPTSVSAGTNLNLYYANKPFIEDDWIGKFEINLAASQIDVANDKITYNLSNQLGDASVTPLKPGDCILFYTPRDNSPVFVNGIDATFRPFIVRENVTGSNTYSYDSNTGIVSFTASIFGSTGSIANISDAGTNIFGNHRIIKGIKITRLQYGTHTTTDNKNVTGVKVTYDGSFGSVNLKKGDKVILTLYSPTSIPSVWWSRFNNYTSSLAASYTTEGYSAFPLIDNPTSSTFILGTDVFGKYATTTADVPLLPGSNYGGAFPISEFPLNNSVYLPPTAGFSTSSFESGDFVGLTTTGTTASSPYIAPTRPNTTIANIPNRLKTEKYNLKAVSGFPNWFKIYSIIGTTLENPFNIVLPQGFVNNTFNVNTYEFKNTINRRDQNTIRLKNEPKFDTNKKFRYSPKGTSTQIGGLNSLNTYLAKSSEVRLGNKFRVGESTFTQNPTIFWFEYPYGSRSQARIGINTNRANLSGIATGKYIQLSGITVNGQEPIANFANSVFRVIPATSGVSTQSNVWTQVLVEIPLANAGFNTDLVFTQGVYNSSTKISGTQITGIVTFSNVGLGTQSAFLNAVGVVDDIYPLTEVNEKNFSLKANYEIPVIVQTTYDGSSNVGVGSTPAWIKLTEHFFADGTKVNYTTDDPNYPIGQLTSGQDYYVRVLDANHIALARTNEVAIDRNNIDDLIVFDTYGSALSGINTHKFTTNSAKGFIIGNANPISLGLDKVGFTSDSNIITGKNGTTFLSDFSTGDLMRIYQLDPILGPGRYFESKIVSVKSNTTLQIEDNITSDVLTLDSSGIGTGNYFVPTRSYVLTDAKASHRPFDGGVSMYAGVTANSKIIRQTRRYFRYQSGKGIQLSMAVNFNPTYDIDNVTGIGSTATIICKFPHGISKNYVSNPSDTANNQKVRTYAYDGQKNPITSLYNNTFDIQSVVDDFQFNIKFDTDVPSTDAIGFLQYNVLNWKDAELRAGMFDDQNGFFYKYDGKTLYAVRRSSTQQLSGTAQVERNSHIVYGVGTQFLSQLQQTGGDTIIIRGQSYKVIAVVNDNQVQIQPAYRGQDSSGIILSKVIDTEIPQSEWNLDRCDGTGSSGYKLDVNRIQMIYMDYSWYGAGSIRFGFKNQDGEVFYCHEFLHNNQFTESYFRSGNLPARYEVSTGDNPGFGPSLFHWGCSVVMDGRFDDDKAYLFTADSDPLPFTNGGITNDIIGNIAAANLNQFNFIDSAEAARTAVGLQFTGAAVVNNYIQRGTKVTGIEVDPTSNKFSTQRYLITFDKPAIQAGSNLAFNLKSGTAAQLRSFIPLVSIRLAPSVDNGATGNLGFRDIINRMQLTLKSAGVLTTHDCEVRLYLNPRLSRDNWVSVGSPSLAQIYKHQVGDSFTGGTKIYSFRASGGAPVSTATNPPKRGFNVTAVSLDELALLGNSILGGDGVYPDGPDVLTIAVRPVDTSQITGGSPFIVSSRITWAEAQA